MQPTSSFSAERTYSLCTQLYFSIFGRLTYVYLPYGQITIIYSRTVVPFDVCHRTRKRRTRANKYSGIHQVQKIDECVDEGVRVLGEGGVCTARTNTQVNEASLDLLKLSFDGTVVCHALAGNKRMNEGDKNKARSDSTQIPGGCENSSLTETISSMVGLLSRTVVVFRTSEDSALGSALKQSWRQSGRIHNRRLAQLQMHQVTVHSRLANEIAHAARTMS